MGGLFSAYEAPEVKSVLYPAYAKSLGGDHGEDDDKPLAGKVFVVTGCTSGTGYVAALTFAKKGAQHVFLLNRPSDRAEACYDRLKAFRHPTTNVTHVDCDLQDFASVRAAAKTVLATSDGKAIDVLCNNAGVMALEDKATKDGYDVQMQTNHLSHFLLTRELFPALEAAAKKRGDARIVNHSSMSRKEPAVPMDAAAAAKYCGKNGGDLGGDGASMFRGGARWVRYHMTKLANVAFTLSLAEKLAGSKVKALCAAPGLAATELQVTTAKAGGMGSGTWFMRLAQSAEDGAVPLLTCCLSPDVKSGEFWEPAKGMHGPATLTPLEPICLEADREALWAASEAAVGAWKL